MNVPLVCYLFETVRDVGRSETIAKSLSRSLFKNERITVKIISIKKLNSRFCDTCLYNSFAQTKKCPICRQSYDYKKIKLDKRLEREINELKHICNSCNWKVKFILYVK